MFLYYTYLPSQHECRGPQGEKMPDGVFGLNPPCDSSNNLKFGDFPLGFTLRYQILNKPVEFNF